MIKNWEKYNLVVLHSDEGTVDNPVIGTEDSYPYYAEDKYIYERLRKEYCDESCGRHMSSFDKWLKDNKDRVPQLVDRYIKEGLMATTKDWYWDIVRIHELVPSE